MELSRFDGSGHIVIRLSGRKNRVSVGEGNCLKNDLRIAFPGIWDGPPYGTTVEIGERNLFNGRVYVIAPVEPGRCVHIGCDNLFADYILFMGRNDHGIFDRTTHERQNVDRDVYLGDRNWVCKDAELYPGARVTNGCVVAAHAIVNKPFAEEHVLLAGLPARVKRRNIVWSVSCRRETMEANEDNPLCWPC